MTLIRRLLSLLIFLCNVQPGSAQSVETPTSAAYAEITTYSKKFISPFGYNEASLASQKKFCAGFFSEQRFMLKELGSHHLAIALPVADGAFGFKAGYFGQAGYNETQLSLAYARKLGKLDAGVQFNYFAINIAGYGKAPSVNFQGGIVVHVTDNFQSGLHIYNPLSSKIGKSEVERLPSIYRFGFGYDISDKFYLGADLQKIEDASFSVRMGMEYRPVEKIFLRAGFSSGTGSFYTGAGFVLSGFRVDVTVTMHPVLGATPGMMLLYQNEKQP